MKDTQFFSRCVELRRRDVLELQRMMDAAREITYDTFLRHVEVSDLEALFPGVYEWSGPWGLSLRRDWAVSYYKGTWYDVPAYVMVHSGIENVWLKRGLWDVSEYVERWLEEV